MHFSKAPFSFGDLCSIEGQKKSILAFAVFSAFCSQFAAAETPREMTDCINPDLEPNTELAACNRVLESGQTTNPHDIAFAHHGRALAYMHKRDFTRSLAEFNEAIRIEPDNSGHYQNRGSLYDYMGDFARALSDYEKAISLDPRRAGPYFDRGLARERHGDREGAIADYLQALRLDPNYIRPQQGLARLNWSGVVIAKKQGQGIVLPVDRQHPPQKPGPASGADSQLNEAISAGRKGDYSTALRLLLPIAQRGNAIAQDTIGGMYFYGQGVARDYSEAVKWYRMAAEQGNASAQFNLGNMFHDGKGVSQNYSEAVRLYRLSAKQGYPPAQSNLGNCYALGRGVKQDNVLAYMWFDMAAKKGLPQAINGRDDLASKLSASEIAEAQRLEEGNGSNLDGRRSLATPTGASTGSPNIGEEGRGNKLRHSHHNERMDISP